MSNWKPTNIQTTLNKIQKTLESMDKMTYGEQYLLVLNLDTARHLRG